MTFTGIMAGWVFSYAQCYVKVTSQFTNLIENEICHSYLLHNMKIKYYGWYLI